MPIRSLVVTCMTAQVYTLVAEARSCEKAAKNMIGSSACAVWLLGILFIGLTDLMRILNIALIGLKESTLM